MYKISETTDKAEMSFKPPFGPGFSDDLVKRATRMEIWGTSITSESRWNPDPDKDFCEFCLYEGDEKIASQIMPGY